MFLVLQVTAKGFAPLLQFVYTAKLILNQENIHEVILCAEFLGVHNLEDSCFRFLQAQLQNDSLHTSNGKVKYDDDITAKDTDFSEEQPLDDFAVSRQESNHLTNTAPLFADLPQCPKYRKYQYQIYDNKHNVENHHGSDNVVLNNHTSVSPVSSQFTGNSATPQTLLTPSKIKKEPFQFNEGGDERNGSNPELCTEEVLEMELEVEGVPVATECSPQQHSPSSCLRSYLQRGGLDLSGMPSASIQQLLNNRLSIDCYRELVKDRKRNKREPLGQFDLKTGIADVIPAALTGISRNLEMPMSKASSSKHEGEIDRCSVIFSSTAGNQHILDRKFREKLSTPPSSGQSCLTSSCPVSNKTSADSPTPSEPCTQTSSSGSSFSFPEDVAGGSSPSSLPLPSSPHSGSIVGLPHYLAGVVEQKIPHSRELVFSQDCTKIKSEQGFGAGGGNSSDESGSFSEGDSESGISRASGPEVSVLFYCALLSRMFFVAMSM